MLYIKSLFGNIFVLGKGSKKKRQIIHILWIRVLPPSLSSSAKVNNIHTKEFLDATV